ncbi:MAG: hypothetical protein M3N14_06985 [Bacteroidota bacterium]|nr:hypothetical protein [Bacteroidota bacterium]
MLDNLDSNKTIDARVLQFDSSKSFKEIVDHCNQADLVVLYYLQGIKIKILSLLNSNVKVAWFFFGAELYGRKTNNYLSLKTKKYLHGGLVRFIVSLFKNKTNQIFGSEKEVKLGAVCRKVDFFMCLSLHEYHALKREWPNLPGFLQLPIDFPVTKSPIDKSAKKNVVIIGNSRNVWNNHFDIAERVLSHPRHTNYSVIIPFNYGGINRYTNRLESTIAGIDNVVCIDKFMPITDYENLVSIACAFVLNAYRPMAMWNIFTAMSNGVKVYLNKRNTTYEWLLDEGFLVFNIDQLIVDIGNDNLNLKDHEVGHNLSLFEQLKEKCSIGKFNDTIIKALGSPA